VSEQRDIDAAILIREDSGKARSRFASPGSGLLPRRWVDVEAEVSYCTLIRNYIATPRDAWKPLGGYVVGFTYEVDGNSYEGILDSPDKVKVGEKFTIRCDPRHPEKNNTFDPETHWTYTYTKIFTIAMILLMLFLFIRSYFFSS
jgi:hypothetical protein